MSRHFTIPKMLSMTPNAQLREFFERLGVTLISIDWKRLKERQIEPLLCAIGWLKTDDQQRVELALAQIFELASEGGWQAIRDAASNVGETQLAREVPEGASTYERAMWTWLNRPEVFQEALLHQRVFSLTRWRKQSGLPVMVPRITPDSTRELAAGLSQCLKREEGRGKKCTVEYFRRSDCTDYFVASPDNFVETITTHDESGQLVPQSLRQTFEIEMPAKCSCRSLAINMDLIGVEGCRLNRETFIERIKANQDKWGWPDKLKNFAAAGFKAVLSGLAFRINPLDPIPGLYVEAIRRAEDKETRS